MPRKSGISADPEKAARQLANLTGKASPGNTHAATHGARGELTVAPKRAEALEAFKERYPKVNEMRLALAADLAARVELACEYIDKRGLFKDRRSGELRPVVVQMDRWAARLDALLAELDRDAQHVDPMAALRNHIEGTATDA